MVWSKRATKKAEGFKGELSEDIKDILKESKTPWEEKDLPNGYVDYEHELEEKEVLERLDK